MKQERDQRIKKYFKDDPDRENIRKQLEKDNEKYDFRKETQFYESLKKRENYDEDEIIEKYVILSYLVDNSYRSYLESG